MIPNNETNENKPVRKHQVIQGACMGCGACETSCPAGAISLTDVAFINESLCIGCGACAGRCPFGAID